MLGLCKRLAEVRIMTDGDHTRMTPTRAKVEAETPDATAIQWRLSRFSELDGESVYAMLALRQRVFVVEQQCAYQDADGLDTAAWHLLGWAGSPAEVIAYARIFEPGIRYAEGSIGRIVTAPGVRQRGIGRVLMKEAMRRCAELFPGGVIRLGAQMRLEKFYEEFGFASVSKPYEEDGILHVEMLGKPSP